MKESRLNELIEKAKQEEITNNEILEVMAATLQSVSRHSKDIKYKLDQMTELMFEIKKELKNEVNHLTGWGKIEEEPDQD
jgi:hypothetical protein